MNEATAKLRESSLTYDVSVQGIQSQHVSSSTSLICSIVTIGYKYKSVSCKKFQNVNLLFINKRYNSFND